MTEGEHTADELLVAVGNLRAASPDLGIKKVVAGVKAANPTWTVGAKEVREALKALDDDPASYAAAKRRVGPSSSQVAKEQAEAEVQAAAAQAAAAEAASVRDAELAAAQAKKDAATAAAAAVAASRAAEAEKQAAADAADAAQAAADVAAQEALDASVAPDDVALDMASPRTVEAKVLAASTAEAAVSGALAKVKTEESYAAEEEVMQAEPVAEPLPKTSSAEEAEQASLKAYAAAERAAAAERQRQLKVQEEEEAAAAAAIEAARVQRVAAEAKELARKKAEAEAKAEAAALAKADLARQEAANAERKAKLAKAQAAVNKTAMGAAALAATAAPAAPTPAKPIGPPSFATMSLSLPSLAKIKTGDVVGALSDYAAPLTAALCSYPVSETIGLKTHLAAAGAASGFPDELVVFIASLVLLLLNLLFFGLTGCASLFGWLLPAIFTLQMLATDGGRVDLMPAVQLYWVTYTLFQLLEQAGLTNWPFGLYTLIKPCALFFLWGMAGGPVLLFIKKRLPVWVEDHYAYPH